MKNTLEGINNRITDVEERISVLEDKTAEIQKYREETISQKEKVKWRLEEISNGRKGKDRKFSEVKTKF